MKIALDLDGVIANTPDIIGRELDKLGFKNRDNSQYKPKIKGVEDIDVLIGKIVIDIFLNKANDIKPYKYVDTHFFKHISQYDITILTARSSIFNNATERWLGENFPGIPFNLVNRCSSDKPKFVKENGYSYFVEDRLRTANSASMLGVPTILINREWNTNRDTYKDISRVSNLHNIIPIIK